MNKARWCAYNSSLFHWFGCTMAILSIAACFSTLGVPDNSSCNFARPNVTSIHTASHTNCRQAISQYLGQQGHPFTYSLLWLWHIQLPQDPPWAWMYHNKVGICEINRKATLYHHVLCTLKSTVWMLLCFLHHQLRCKGWIRRVFLTNANGIPKKVLHVAKTHKHQPEWCTSLLKIPSAQLWADRPAI